MKHINATKSIFSKQANKPLFSLAKTIYIYIYILSFLHRDSISSLFSEQGDPRRTVVSMQKPHWKCEGPFPPPSPLEFEKD